MAETGSAVAANRRAPKLRDSVAAQLRSRILAGDWPVGAKLPTESELCEEFGVSRSVIRDAVRALVSQGLIEVRHGLGTLVAEPDETATATNLVLLLGRCGVTVGDVLDARVPIEVGVAGQAALSASREDLSTLAEVLEQLKTAVEERDTPRAAQLHSQWHQQLLATCHLPALSVLLGPLQVIIDVTALPPKLNDVDYWDVPSHEAILTSVRKGDPQAAQEAARRHFEPTLSRDYKRLRRTPFHAMRTLEAFDQVLGER